MLFEPYIRFLIFSKGRVTEWPPIRKAAHSAFDMFIWYKRVQVGNDQEMVQSERHSHSMNRGVGKKT